MGNYASEIQAAVTAQVKAELAAKDWKQSDLAKATGMQASTLHRYLSNARDIPLPVLVDMAEALGMSYIELAQRAHNRLQGENVS